MLSSLNGRTRVSMARRLEDYPCRGKLSPLALQQFCRANAQPFHPRSNLGPFFLKETVALAFAEACARTRGDEHADAAFHDDQAFVLEALIGLGDRQRVRLLFRSQRSNRRK